MTRATPAEPASRRQRDVPAVQTASAPITDEAIRKRAFELYQLRGGSFGDPLADWLAAEHELRNRGCDTGDSR
ncbi:hypothetical protein RAS1_01640 [Phycisphaerae bacterium RAS1]|nr:hypothetical protein RAS1_01640 [Phycisphaerae bacterium RAS1]